MWFEIYSKGNLIKRGDEILNDDLDWTSELMDVPSLSITLPITYLDYINGREEIKIFVNDKCFWGIINGVEVDKAEEVIDLDIEHVIHEWTYRQISINNAVKDKNVNIIFKGSVIKSENGRNISASPFDMLIDEVDEMSNAKYIKRAGATAWTDNGDPLKVTSVDASAVKRKPGTYNVTFGIGNLEVTVKGTVKTIDGSQTATKDNVTVSAVPFEVSIDNLSELTDSDYIEMAFATAWSTKE